MSQQQRRQPKKPKKPRVNRDPIGTPSMLPSDFSKQCHFTQHNFSCNHHTWVTDPKIMHVAPCKCKHHKNLCDNMAKSTKEVQFDTVCSSCSDAAGENTGSTLSIGLDLRLNMAEAVKKRIFELEQQKKIIRDSVAASRKASDSLAPRSSSKPVTKPKAQTTESDWGMDEVAPFQPLPKPVVKVAEMPKSPTKRGSKSTTKKQYPPSDDVALHIYDSFFEDNFSLEEDELYQQGKERERWRLMPESKNGNGAVEKPTGLLGTLFNSVPWKTKPKFVLREAKPETPLQEISKVDSDDEPWDDHGEWIHIVENVADN